MDTQYTRKLKPLLDQWPHNGVVTSARLNALHISAGLARSYVTNGWLVRIGSGAYQRPADRPSWVAGVQALQEQLGLDVHVGALTALTAHGFSHYLRAAEDRVFLFSQTGGTLPAWFRKHDWQTPIHHAQTNLLPPLKGIEQLRIDGVAIKASSPERAILECLHLSPQIISLDECAHLVESLVSIRPVLMQELLETCGSVKVKRLFLYFAERANLPIFKHLDVSVIDLGSGNRALVKDGKYNAKYQLSLPKELVQDA
jgi:hypothetical protein